MTYEFVGVEDAIARDGLRMVFVGNVPRGEAGKGIFRIRESDLGRHAPGPRQRAAEELGGRTERSGGGIRTRAAARRMGGNFSHLPNATGRHLCCCIAGRLRRKSAMPPRTRCTRRCSGLPPH